MSECFGAGLDTCGVCAEEGVEEDGVETEFKWSVVKGYQNKKW